MQRIRRSNFPCGVGMLDNTLQTDISDDAECAITNLGDLLKISDLLGVASFCFDSHGCICEINDRACRMTQFTRPEILGKRVTTFFSPFSLTIAPDEPERDLVSKLPRQRCEMVRKDGTTVPCEIQIKKVKVTNILYHLVIATEIPDQQAVEEVQVLKRRLAEAQRIAQTGSWVWEPATDSVWWSDEIYLIFGFDKSSVTPSFNAFLSLVHPEDRPRAVERVQAILMGGEEFADDLRLIRPSGEEIWINSRGRATRDQQGNLIRVNGTDQVITARKRAERELEKSAAQIQESERRFRELADAIPQIVWIAGADGSLTHLNAKATEYSGIEIEYLKEWSWGQAIHPDDLPTMAAAWREAIHTGIPRDIEARIRRADGTYRWHVSRQTPVRSSTGEIAAWYGTCTDIEDLKLTEAALRAEQNLLQTLIDSIPDLVYTKDEGYRFRKCNRALVKYLGVESESDLLGKTVFDLVSRDQSRPCHDDDMRVLIDGETIENREILSQDSTGRSNWRLVNKAPLRDDNGKIVGLVAISRNIQEIRERQQQLDADKSRWALAMAAANLGTWDRDLITGNVTYSPECLTILGTPALQETHACYTTVIHPADVEAVRNSIHQAIVENGGFDVDYRIRLPSGELRWVHDVGRTILHEDGQATRMSGVINDITARKLAETELRLQRDRFAKIAQTIPGAIVSFQERPDGSWCIPYASSHFEKIYGIYPREVISDAGPIFRTVHPEDLDSVKESILESKRKMAPWNATYRVNHPKLGLVWVEGNSTPTLEADGSVVWHGVITDITEKKRLEEHLRRSQKLEGIGQLAGGIAHDFKNILTVILCSARLAQERQATLSVKQEMLKDIELAAETGVDLTKNLLVFSQQQPKAPRIVNLNQIIEDQSKFLRRLVGTHIEFHYELAANDGLVRVDAAEIGQVLVNLVSNARDAMPTGGELTIETRDVVVEIPTIETPPDMEPGSFCRLRVTDTGVGMDPAMLQQIFEPFFTTKAQGKGTGLGLSVVYGILKQANARIWVRSQPGQGTTFYLYFPRAASSKAESARPVSDDLPRGAETILLVEDEDAVRNITRFVLTTLGYDVLVARDGITALDMFDKHRDQIALVVTDMLMPKMTGATLANLLRARRPGIKILLTSAFENDSEVRPEFATIEFLKKPYTPRSLATTIRQILDTPTIDPNSIGDVRS